ncbi:hypothetical protein [Natrinema pallidum]|uniref:hypothetical protein n=1 Tax=Natrinema pallidum TaxID=69527 RepID=UPI000B1CD6C4|nr:hypothetical protein [Natrinema pallidum]
MIDEVIEASIGFAFGALAVAVVVSMTGWTTIQAGLGLAVGPIVLAGVFEAIR